MTEALKINDSLPADINPPAPVPSTVEELQRRYDFLFNLVWTATGQLIRRRSSGEIVPKEETENQAVMMRDLKRLEQMLSMAKKVTVIKPDVPEAPPEETKETEGPALAKIKNIKSTVANIQQHH